MSDKTLNERHCMECAFFERTLETEPCKTCWKDPARKEFRPKIVSAIPKFVGHR